MRLSIFLLLAHGAVSCFGGSNSGGGLTCTPFAAGARCVCSSGVPGIEYCDATGSSLTCDCGRLCDDDFAEYRCAEGTACVETPTLTGSRHVCASPCRTSGDCADGDCCHTGLDGVRGCVSLARPFTCSR